MALLSMGVPESPILRFSIVGWAMVIVDSASMIIWPDMDLLISSGFSVRSSDRNCMLQDGYTYNIDSSKLAAAGEKTWINIDCSEGIMFS